MMTKGCVKWNSRIRLRHYVSGLYLAIARDEITKVAELKLVKDRREDTVFELEMIVRNINQQSLGTPGLTPRQLSLHRPRLERLSEESKACLVHRLQNKVYT
jgi:hypothetical protein